MTRAELIAALVAASEGRWQLDLAIANVVGGPITWRQEGYVALPYTTSLDTAETLWATPDPLPKRRPWRAIQYWNDYRPGGRPYWRAKALECRDGVVLEIAVGEHKIKRIAACIAALKALD